MISIDRRYFLSTTAAIAAGAALPAAAIAQTASVEELMAPGALPDIALGDAKAPVTIIEYASATCPHCASFHENTYPELKKRYIDTGKVRFIFREFPFDPVASAAFMLARCAPADKYYPMLGVLFSQQNVWAVERPVEPLLAIAKQAGFTQETFNACLTDQKLLDNLNALRDRAAQKFGVNSTPTFFVNGKIVRGNQPIEELAKLIDPLLK